MADPLAPPARPTAADVAHERAYVVWIGAGGCGGWTMSVLGAVSPTLEEPLAGIDVLRAVRSFDPCLPRAVHLHSGGTTPPHEFEELVGADRPRGLFVV